MVTKRPKCDEKLSSKSNDVDLRAAALLMLGSLLEPLAERTVGLPPQPEPGDFNHDLAYQRIACLGDALIAVFGTTVVGAGCHAGIRRDLPTIGKVPIKHLTIENDGRFRPDALECDQTCDGAVFVFLGSLKRNIALGFDLADLIEN